MSRARRQNKPKAEMRSGYEFDYKRARPNRFAPRLRSTAIAVNLDPDVARVFHSSESVNKLLRSVIAAVPKGRNGAKSAKLRRKLS